MNKNTLIRALIGLGIGGLGCLVASRLPLFDGLVATLNEGLHYIWDKVGVASLGLVPMSLWLVYLLIRQVQAGGTVTDNQRQTYAYLAQSAPSWGLLGTIVALIVSTGVLATEVVNNGPGAAIQAIGPLIGQALISTAVGLVISLAAGGGDFFVRKTVPAEVRGGDHE